MVPMIVIGKINFIRIIFLFCMRMLDIYLHLNIEQREGRTRQREGRRYTDLKIGDYLENQWDYVKIVYFFTHLSSFKKITEKFNKNLFNIRYNILALSQLRICRPLPSVLIPFSWKMRNVLNRMKDQFFDFYFSSYRENSSKFDWNGMPAKIHSSSRKQAIYWKFVCRFYFSITFYFFYQHPY